MQWWIWGLCRWWVKHQRHSHKSYSLSDTLENNCRFRFLILFCKEFLKYHALYNFKTCIYLYLQYQIGSFTFCQVNSLKVETPWCHKIKHNTQFSLFPFTTENLEHFWAHLATEYFPSLHNYGSFSNRFQCGLCSYRILYKWIHCK